jgi:hypothetical protein
MIGQLLKVIVVKERVARIDQYAFGLIHQSTRIQDRIVKSNQRPAITISARMRQLKSDNQIVIRAKYLPVTLPTSVHHSLELGGRFFIQEQLSGIGSAFLGDGSGLAPNELCAATAKSVVSAESQIIGPAIESAVAPFHRLNAQRIARSKLPKNDWTKEWTQILAEAQVYFQPITFGFQLRQGVEFEKASHSMKSEIRKTKIRNPKSRPGFRISDFEFRISSFGFLMQPGILSRSGCRH